MTARPVWVVAILFTLVGFVLPVTGHFLHPLFMLLGLPFSMLGWLLFGLLFYSEHLRRSDPARYPAWCWWINLIGGIAGVAIFAIPAFFVFPAFLLLGMREHYLLGALFTVLGLGTGVATIFVALHLIRHRPREFERPQEPDSEWDTEAYRRWLQKGSKDTPPKSARDDDYP